jgi:hypothetical protein
MSMVTPEHVHTKADGEQFAASTSLTTVTCFTCKMTYAIPTSLYKSAKEWTGDRDDGRGWKLCCPVGHTWWYIGKKTEAERLKEQLERERETRARVAADRDQYKADAKAQRARGTRYKNDRDRERRRAAQGVCPCCGRSFAQLKRHLAAKHPDYLAEQGIEPQRDERAPSGGVVSEGDPNA